MSTGDDPDDSNAAKVPHDLDGDSILNEDDSCPLVANDLIDLDEDATDDARDTLINLTGIIVEYSTLVLNAVNTQGNPIQYQVGHPEPDSAPYGQLTIADGGRLILVADARLYFINGGHLRLEPATFDGPKPVMSISQQAVNLRGVDFIGNHGYPLRCGIEDHIFLRTSIRADNLTCLESMIYGKYSGNYFNGPTIAHFENMKFPSGIQFDRALDSERGTDSLYIHDEVTLQAESVIDGIKFKHYRRITARDSNGRITETSDSFIPGYLMLEFSDASFSNSEFEIPIKIYNSEVSFDQSKFPTSLYVYDVDPEENSKASKYSSIVIANSEIQLDEESLLLRTEAGEGQAVFTYAHTENMPLTLENVSFETSVVTRSIYVRHRHYDADGFKYTSNDIYKFTRADE